MLPKAVNLIHAHTRADTFGRRLVSRINEAILEAGIAKFNKEVFTTGTLDREGKRPLFGPGFTHVGDILPDGTPKLWGHGEDEAEYHKKRRHYMPKAVGYDVSWDDPTPGISKSSIGRPNIKASRIGRFFPFIEGEDIPCVVCGGKGATFSGKPGDDTPIRCQSCQGVGAKSPKVEKFLQNLSSRGLNPTVRPARGKARKYPEIGKELQAQ